LRGVNDFGGVSSTAFEIHFNDVNVRRFLLLQANFGMKINQEISKISSSKLKAKCLGNGGYITAPPKDI
jgi:hypothetical protein